MPGAEPVEYLYDGSYEGLLCCVYASVYGRETPVAILAEAEAEPSLFCRRFVETDREKAARVHASIGQKICPEAVELVRDTFFSEVPGRELLILRFLLLGYRQGRAAYLRLSHPVTAPLYAAQRRLLNEAHQFLQFLRFSDVNGVLVAKIAPKGFVLPYLAAHFCSRYAVEEFLIYDTTHGAALVWQGKRVRLTPLDRLELPPVTADEARMRALWRQFYETIAIEARINPRCRMNHCPKRYWGNMTEFSQEDPYETAFSQIGAPRRGLPG